MRLYPYFDEEGDIGGYTPEEPAFEPSSVATEEEPSGDGNAPTPAESDATSQEEVDRQQSFAQRLKEQTEKRLAEERAKWEQETNPKLSALEKRARQEGFGDVQSYLQAIDELEQRQQVERESQRMGVDPDTYAQYFQPVNQQLTELQQKVQTYEKQLTEREQQEQTNQVWGELYKEYPGLVETAKSFNEGKNPEWFTKDMQDLVSMGYKPVHAYELAHKNTLFQQKEQEVLARVTGRDERQILPSNDKPNNVQFDPANMTDEQLEDISRRVQNGEKIRF